MLTPEEAEIACTATNAINAAVFLGLSTFSSYLHPWMYPMASVMCALAAAYCARDVLRSRHRGARL